MITTKGYYDLCIQETCFNSNNLEANLKRLYDYGYRTIAINQVIEDGNIETKKKKKKGEPRHIKDIVPVPFNLQAINEICKRMKWTNFKVFNRLTINFANQDILHKIIKSANFKKYHIIAAAPTTNQAFAYTCGQLEADIFTFNPENKFGFRLNRKLYNQLVNSQYHIELLYAPAIEDTTKRKNIIHAAHIFHSYGKSKNILISSGARSLELLRGPYDIINLGFIFGLSPLQSKNAISHCGRQVVINSVSRKFKKALMFVEVIDQNNKRENVDTTVWREENEEEDVMETDQPQLKKTKIHI